MLSRSQFDKLAHCCWQWLNGQAVFCTSQPALVLHQTLPSMNCRYNPVSTRHVPACPYYLPKMLTCRLPLICTTLFAGLKKAACARCRTWHMEPDRTHQWRDSRRVRSLFSVCQDFPSSWSPTLNNRAVKVLRWGLVWEQTTPGESTSKQTHPVGFSLDWVGRKG